MRTIVIVLVTLSLIMVISEISRSSPVDMQSQLVQKDQADIVRYTTQAHLLKPEMAYGYRPTTSSPREYQPRNYCGHFISWKSWKDHLSITEKKYNGAYYKRNGSLYYEFNMNGSMYVFSVGK